MRGAGGAGEVSPLLIVAAVVLMVAGTSVTLIELEIANQVEEGLDIPLEKRPSWIGGWGKQRMTEYLRVHRKMYPRSRLRLWLWASMATGAAGLLAGVIAVLWRV